MTGASDPAQGAPDAAPSEESLLRGARAGERAAVERLYAGHVDWTRRVAAILAGPESAEALVSETFARALGQLRAGRGPTAGFGPHLLTTMSTLHRTSGGIAVAAPVDGLDTSAATAGVSGLPERMRQALWLAEVEGRRPDVVAQRLGMAPDAAGSLVDRSRERLRRSYLDQHGAERPMEDGCRWTRKRLGAHIRGDLKGRPSATVEGHLVGCSACAAARAELAALDTRLATDIFPLVLAGVLGAADGPADGRSRGLGDLPGRTAFTVAASVVAVVAIAATSWGLARHGGEPHTAPSDPDTSGPTFGPNQPSLTPTPTAPLTLPEVPDATAPTTPYSPTFPSSTYPSSTYPSSTYPSSTYPSSTYPSSTYPTTTFGTSPYQTPTSTPTASVPTSTPTSPEAQPVKVWPVAPTARKITRCGTYGSLRVARTEGVRYTRVVGDGTQGRWVVRATARSGYTIASGATRRFSGNLGRYSPCLTLAIGEVTTSSTGDPATDPWVVTVAPSVPEKERRLLSVTYTFDTGVMVVGKNGAGWTCRGPGDVEISPEGRHPFEASAALTCTFGDRESRPPPVSLTVRADNESGAPSGSVSLSADDVVVDSEGFDAAP